MAFRRPNGKLEYSRRFANPQPYSGGISSTRSTDASDHDGTTYSPSVQSRSAAAARAPASERSASRRSGRPSSAVSDATSNLRNRPQRASLMNLVLPRLNDSALDLYHHLQRDAPHDAEWHTMLQFFRTELSHKEDAFSDGRGGIYIDAQKVVEELEAEGKLPGLARPEQAVRASICVVNLTDLLYEIVAGIDEHRLDLLQALDRDFPHAFNMGQAASDPGDFEMALEIRTQLMIETLTKYHRNSLEVLAMIFCDEQAPVEDPQAALVEENYRPLGGIDFLTPSHEAQWKALRERVASIRELISDVNLDDEEASKSAAAVDARTLRQAYPFDSTFLDELKDWLTGWFEVVRREYDRSDVPEDDGRGEPQDGNPEFGDDMQEGSVGSASGPDDVPREETPGASGGPAGSLLRTEAMIKRLLTGKLQAATGTPPSHQAAIGEASGASSNDAADITNQEVIRRFQDHIASSASGTSTRDRNDNERSGSSVSPGGQKRRRNQGDDEEEEEEEEKEEGEAEAEAEDNDDDEFDVDERIPESQRRPLAAPRPSQLNAPKRVRISGSAEPMPPSKRRSMSIELDAPRRRSPSPSPWAGSPAGSPPGSLASGIDVGALSQRSRLVSAVARRGRLPVQTRVRWSDRDTQRLIEAIGTYGNKWSQLETAQLEGHRNFDTFRNQQALRDKARLIKQDFLKTDAVLPPNFDFIVLGPKERNAIMAVGRNPDRLESDVNAEGRPVDTMYQDPDDDGVFD